MTPDDAIADLLTVRCMCDGSGVIHLGTMPVPCPDCGDV